MNRLRDTSTIVEDEATLSENVITSEKDGVVSTAMDVDEKDVITSNFGFGEDTSFEPLEEATRKELQKVNSTPPKIQVFDVAAYILDKMGKVTTMKLQKLVYYSQAWSLVWDEKPLFEEKVEAWANGPVVRNLFDYHRGMYEISAMPIGNPRLLDQDQQDTINAVLAYYGDKPAQWLIELTHMEDPWKQARKGLTRLERGDRVISLSAMADYYSSLSVEDDYEDEE